VTLLGLQPHDVLHSYLQGARAFIFAAEEDYGIAPIEAQACGTPVLAYGKGGACETVVDGVTGYHFAEPTPDAIRTAVERFESTSDRFHPGSIRTHALQFSESRFKHEFGRFVESRYELHRRMISQGTPAKSVRQLGEVG
jgi:glycosyltransferase involved in cell wall biosynthesis